MKFLIEHNKNPVLFGNARISIYSAGAIRAEYRKNKDFPGFPSVLTGSYPPKKAFFCAERSGKKLVLETKKLVLTYREREKGFTEDTLSIKFKVNGKTVTWKPWERPAGVLSRHQRSFDEWPAPIKRYRHRGQLNRCGWNIIEDKKQAYLTKEGWLENRKEKDSQDFYFFVYGADYKKAIEDYVSVFGKIPLLPDWAFGLWFSRFFKFSDKQLLELIARFRRKDIPLDVLVVDTDWRKFRWHGYEWNKRLFPDPGNFIGKLKELKIKIGLNDHPGYGHMEALPRDESLSKKIKEVQGKDEAFLDFRSKEITDIWLKYGILPLIKDGIDFLWVDGWGNGAPVKGVDTQLWLNKLYTGALAKNSPKAPLIISRWGGIGSHRYPFSFSGDIASTWSNLRNQIKTQTEGFNAASAYISFDLGGFFGKPLRRHKKEKLKKDETLGFCHVYKKKINTELYIRWIELGAFSPIMRLHSHQGYREPWRYGGKAVEIFRRYVKARYRLFPYMQDLAKEAHFKGISPIRPLYVEYPRDPSAYKYLTEYLLGKNLLIVPADAPVKNGYARKKAYFPEGNWVDIESGEIVEGRSCRTLRIPLDKIPVFARAGSVIPVKEYTNRIGGISSMIMEIYPDKMGEGMSGIRVRKEDSAYSLNIFVGERSPKVIRINGKTVNFKRSSGRIIIGAKRRYVYVSPMPIKGSLLIEVEYGN